MEEGPFPRRIQTEFPDLQWTFHRYLAHGWDHAVLILDEALVFRAPKAKAYRDALADEARRLRYLQLWVEVGIPDYVYQSADGSFAGYPIRVGRELDAATFGRLSADKRGRIADQLAASTRHHHRPHVLHAPLNRALPAVAGPVGARRGGGGELFEFACHEGNHAVTNVLRGARAQDDEVKQAGPRLTPASTGAPGATPAYLLRTGCRSAASGWNRRHS